MSEPPLKKRKSRFGAKVTAVSETAEQIEKRQAALEVAAKLGQMLGDTSGGVGGGGAVGVGNGYMNVAGDTEKIQVPTEKVGAIIGKGGAKIKEIQEVTSTRMQVAREGDPNTPHLRDVSITGALENRERAKAMVNAVLEETNRFSGQFSEGREVKRIEVPIHCVGMIIGRGGETIRRIKSESQCSISVEREEEAPTSGPNVARPGNRNVFLKGQADAIARAERAIFELIQNADRRGGGFGRGGFNQYNHPQGFQHAPPINQRGGYQPNSFQQGFVNMPPTGYGHQASQQHPPVWQQQQGGFQQPPPQQRQQEGTYDPFRPLDSKFSNPSAQQNGGGPQSLQQGGGAQDRFSAHPPQQNYSSSNFPSNPQAPGGSHHPQYEGAPNPQQVDRPPQPHDQGGHHGFDPQKPREQYRPYDNGQSWSTPQQSAPHQTEPQYQRAPNGSFSSENPPQQSEPRYRDQRGPRRDVDRDQRPGAPGQQYGEQGGSFDNERRRRGTAPNNSYGSEPQYRPSSQRSEMQYRDQRR